jgi:hypothetical protein
MLLKRMHHLLLSTIVVLGLTSLVSSAKLQAKIAIQPTIESDVDFDLKFQSFDAVGNPIPNSEFEIRTLLCYQGNQATIQFPLFNFQTGVRGAIIRSLNKLPEEFRPEGEQQFFCSDNDAYLQTFSLLGPFPTPLSSLTLTISRSGRVMISNNGGLIPAGGHSFNSQTVSYIGKEEVARPKVHYLNSLFTLQLLDYQNFALPGTTFPIPATVETEGDLVKINLPSISFTTTGATSPLNESAYPLILGGYVNTFSGFLSANLRPTQIQTVFDLSSGLNLSIDTYGNLSIASPNTVTGVIPVGSYTTAPISIKYHVPRQNEFEIKNFIIQPAFTNFANSTNPQAITYGIRNFETNDLYQGKLAWTWVDNSAQEDQTDNQMDGYVAIGQVYEDHLQIGDPIRLTELPTNIRAASPGVAINRDNPSIIAVSFHTVNLTITQNQLVVYASTDGGETWSGPINVDPSLNVVGASRIGADKYGNFWIMAPLGGINNLGVYASSDGGFNWNLIFETTDGPTYDYPQIAFGNNGRGDYGLWFAAEYFDANNDTHPRLGFIPTTGLGQFGSGSTIVLEQLINCTGDNALAVKADGTVFINNTLGEYTFYNNYYANTLLVKSPGPLTPALVSAPMTILNSGQNILPTASYPAFDYTYFPTTVNNSFYDERRKALYMVYTEQPDPNSQDLYLYMVVSFNEGVSWSKRIELASSYHNNRGFSSIAFDQEAGTMNISWYDSRNSPDGTGEQYFGAYLNKNQLDCIVKHLRKNSL